MTDFSVARLARKWRDHCWLVHKSEGLCYECAPAALREVQRLLRRVEELEAQEIWVIEEGVEGEGVYTLAICRTEGDALKVKTRIEQERGHLCPDLVPEVYHLPDEYEAALRSLGEGT